MRIFWVALGMFAGTAFAADSITCHKDVEPILQAHCQSCHRPGQTAPMSLLSYDSARPWAKAMKNAVLTRKMPQWADAGAPEGDPRAAPTAVTWPADGWEIQPDFIVNGPEVAVPAKPKANVIEWTYITVPGGFKEDTWVTSM